MKDMTRGYIIRLAEDVHKKKLTQPCFLQHYNGAGQGQVDVTTLARKAKKFVSESEAKVYVTQYGIGIFFKISIEKVK